MRLRNKKTGEVVQNFDGFTTFTNDWSSAKNLQYTSLTKLNEEWEDYKPAEPLIKDEKIRKAVRAWAIITFDWGKWTENTVRVGYEGDDIYCFKIYDCLFEIPLPKKETIADGEYTIAELCGEEEE